VLADLWLVIDSLSRGIRMHLGCLLASQLWSRVGLLSPTKLLLEIVGLHSLVLLGTV